MIKTACCKFAGMKTFITIVIMLPAVMLGQTTDSIPAKNLDEIIVVPDRQRADNTKTVYIPDNRQKQTADGGLSLLSRMNIPQLSVNPLSEVVKTATGQDVTIFIDYNPSSTVDIAALNPSDVQRVEYLDFPVDPRFMRAAHVVNFIMKHREHGGYTKFTGKERFMTASGTGGLYSKFLCRKMEYDLMLTGSYDNNTHTGTSDIETYRLNNMNITRTSETLSDRHREWDGFGAFRISWRPSVLISLRNTVSIQHQETPENLSSGTVDFSSIYPSGQILNSETSNGNIISWNNETYVSLANGWTLNNSLNLTSYDNAITTNYSTGKVDIYNRANERGWNLRENIQVNKSLTRTSDIFANIIAGGSKSRIIYTGSSNETNRFNFGFIGGCTGLSLNLSKLSGSIDAGIAFETNCINGKRVNDLYPFIHSNIQYTPNSHNTFDLWFQYAAFSPDASMKNPNTIRQNELLYISGNPELKCARHISANVSYTFFPGNHLQLSYFASFFRITDRQIPIFTPDGPGGLMLKHYENNGAYNHGQTGARLTLKLFNNSLAVTLAPRLLLYRTTGSNRVTHCPFTCSVNADYYIRRFYFNIFWNSRSSYVDGETCFLRKMPTEYSIGAGWSNGSLNIRLSAINMLRSSWKMSDDTLVSKWYDCKITKSGIEFHRRIALTITYTLSYGKRVNPTDEITGEDNRSSSILH